MACKNIKRTKWFKIIKNEIFLNKKSYDFPISEIIKKDFLSKALMKLNKNYRQIIILYYYQEFSISDISYILNKNPNSVNQQLFRARKKLKEILINEGIDYEF